MPKEIAGSAAAGDGQRLFRTNDVLILSHYYSGIDAINGFPDPIVDAINVYRQEIYFAGEAIFRDEMVYIFGCNPGGYLCGWKVAGVRAIIVEVAAALDGLFITVDQEAGPSVVNNQVRRVAVADTRRSQVNYSPIRDPDY